jgi:hypothetical protein
MKLRELWGRLIRASYTSALERDVARLRTENRALLNSILGIAGVPPIVVTVDESAASAAVGYSTEKTTAGLVPGPEVESATSKPAVVGTSSATNVGNIGTRASAERGMKSVAAPMRRRSWHQVYRMLEIDAARKKEAV